MNIAPFIVLLTGIPRREDPAPLRDPSFRDPLAHPDLARMGQRELADLQFMPGRVAPD